MNRFLGVSFVLFVVICGAAVARMQTRKRGGPQRQQRDIVQFANKDIYFQASSAEATFRDGAHYNFESDSIQYNSTIIGDYLEFGSGHGNVRLYVIPPALDWKRNETYHWKLNQAWMSDAHYGWIFWNVNGYIDSEIQVSSSNNKNPIFQCNHIEFTFWNNSPKGRFGGNEGRVVLKNVKLAAFLSPEFDEKSLTLSTPCGASGTCRARNGSIACASGDYWKYGATIVSFLVAVCITMIASSRSPATRSSRYRPVDDQDEATASDNDSLGDDLNDNDG